MEPVKAADDESVVTLLERARTLHSSQPSIAAHHDEIRRLPIRVRDERQSHELAKLLSSGGDQFVWVQCVMPSDGQVDEDDREVAKPNAPVLFAFLRDLQLHGVTTIRELSLSGVGVTGEAFKALLSLLRSSPPPLRMLLLDNVGLTQYALTEVAIAAAESPTLEYLSVAGNALGPECGAPLALLIRRSSSLRVLDTCRNLMRSKGVLELLVAVRDRELTQIRAHQPKEDSILVSVNNQHVVVTLGGAPGGAGATAPASGEGGELAFKPSAFELRVSDNTLTASETAILLLTELENARVTGVPDTAATFTAPGEKAVHSGTEVPDGKAVRRAMKQQVEKLLESGSTSNSIVVRDTEEALMLAQIVNSTGRPSVQLDFPKGTKHFVKAEILESFLQGVRDNTSLQVIACSNAALSRAEMVPFAAALTWNNLCILRKLDLRKNFLGQEGSVELARALRQNKTLTTLDVTDTQMGMEGCRELCDALRSHPALDRFSLGNNNIRAEGAHALRDAFVDNMVLRRLELPGNKLGPKGATFIARLILGNRGLLRLNVSSNGLRTAGVCEILAACKENFGLMRLDMNDNPLNPQEGEAALAAAIRNDKTLVQVSVAACGIPLGPLVDQALETSRTLRSLGSDTPVSPAAQAVLDRNAASQEALERACEQGDLDAVKRLVREAPLYHLGRKTLLHHATIGGQHVLRYLLGVPEVALQVMAKDGKGQTPLHEAARLGSVDAAHLLLQAGAIANLRDNDGQTPLDLATDPAFRKVIEAEESFLLAQRVPAFSVQKMGDTSLATPLQVWKSERPVSVGSRFSESTEPSHPFFYLKEKVAPAHRRTGYWSQDALQRFRDLLIFVVLVSWMYELLEIPVRFGFAPNPIPGGYWALALFMDGLFIFYLVWNLLGHRAAYEPDSDSSEFAWLWRSESATETATKAQLLSRRRKRRQKLLRSRQIIPMALAAVPWDCILFIIWLGYSDQENVIDPVVLDVFQGLRFMRMAVVMLSNEHFSIVVGAFNLGWAAVEMCKMAIWLFYLLNTFAGVYFFAGRVAIRYGEPSWIDIADFLITPGTLITSDLATQYRITMYYVTFGITNSPFPQANWFEAFLWCAEFLGLGLVFVAYIFGIIIDRIVQLREAREKIQNAQDKIVEYCSDLNLPDKVERKIVKKWMSMGEHDLEIEITTIGEMISPLSRDLRKEITLHLVWSWIETWSSNREERQANLDAELVNEALLRDNYDPALKTGDAQLPDVFPFTLYWHTLMKKLCFHPEHYVSHLVAIVDTLERKLYLQDDLIYDFEDPSSNLYMIIEGSVSLRVGRVRSGKEVLECRLSPGDWFGWEALRGFAKHASKTGRSKPLRTTAAKALKNTTVWVVPTARFRKLYERDNEARFDLQDRWLSNMDRDVLAWLLRYSPPTQLDGNELVTECETPLEREQMKQVLLKTMLSRGAHDKKTKKDTSQLVKALALEVASVKQDIESLRTLSLSVKEALAKHSASMTEMLQAQAKLIDQNVGVVMNL